MSAKSHITASQGFRSIDADGGSLGHVDDFIACVTIRSAEEGTSVTQRVFTPTQNSGRIKAVPPLILERQILSALSNRAARSMQRPLSNFEGLMFCRGHPPRVGSKSRCTPLAWHGCCPSFVYKYLAISGNATYQLG